MIDWGIALVIYDLGKLKKTRHCYRHHTSDKDVSRVGLISRLGGDTKGVEAFILFVQVGEGQRGSVSTPVHVVPFRRRQQNT